MRPPRQQADDHQALALLHRQGAVVQGGVLCLRPGRGHGKRHAPGLVAPELILHPPGRRRRRAVDDGKIAFPEAPVRDLGRKLPGRPLRPGEDHRAADDPVQPVDGADVGRRVPQGLTQQVGHPARLVCR